MRIRIGEAELGDGACRVIAEAGVNHNNSIDVAVDLARRAADAGAWAIKFQLYKADTIAVKDSPKYWTDEIGTSSQYESFAMSDRLDYPQYEEIAAACKEFGIEFFATPFDLRAVEVLEDIGVRLYKIASGDLTNRELLRAVASTGKPTLLSTGAATEDEIADAIEFLGVGPERLVLLVCTLAYPTPDGDAHFARIESFRARFAPYLIGTSDHTLGTAGAWMTAALGGVCIEKHYTLDKTLPDVPDHRISVEPHELQEMVDICDRAVILRGGSEIGVRDVEQPARANARRSIVIGRDVSAGHVLTAEDLIFRRPGTGLPPTQAHLIVGGVTRRALRRGELLALGDIVEAAELTKKESSASADPPTASP